MRAIGNTLKFGFFAMRVYYKKIDHMLKPPEPKFRSDLSSRFRDIAEKQVPAKLKPTVIYSRFSSSSFFLTPFFSAGCPNLIYDGREYDGCNHR